MTVLRYTEGGESHGLINEVGNSVPLKETRFPESTREQMKKLRKEDAKIVKARYLNSRGPGERLEMVYCKWDGDPLQSWRFIPMQEYEVPTGLVNQVNGSGLKIRSKEDSDKTNINKVETVERIHSFVPVSF